MLELSNMAIDSNTFLVVIQSIPALHELKLVQAPWLTDAIFQRSPSPYVFPPLHRLSVEHAPQLTVDGLRAYLARPEAREMLSALSLSSTGVHPASLRLVLADAPYLTDLCIIESVSSAFPVEPIPFLASGVLRTLHFEIVASPSAYGFHNPAEPYYNYLTDSLLSHALPSLRDLYVRSDTFPETLIAPPALPFASQQSNGASRGLLHPLSVYSKGPDDVEWHLTSVFPPSGPGKRGSVSITRPISGYSYSASLCLTSSGDSKGSSAVGAGFGAFLAVPTEDGGRSGSPLGRKARGRRESSNSEGWMG